MPHAGPCKSHVEVTGQHCQTREMCYKTKPCKFHEIGQCNRGQACAFAHSIYEVQPLPDLHKTELCISFKLYGSCRKGNACHYAHGGNELRTHVDRQQSKNKSLSGCTQVRNNAPSMETHSVMQTLWSPAVQNQQNLCVRVQDLQLPREFILSSQSNAFVSEKNGIVQFKDRSVLGSTQARNHAPSMETHSAVQTSLAPGVQNQWNHGRNLQDYQLSEQHVLSSQSNSAVSENNRTVYSDDFQALGSCNSCPEDSPRLSGRGTLCAATGASHARSKGDDFSRSLMTQTSEERPNICDFSLQSNQISADEDHEALGFARVKNTFVAWIPIQEQHNPRTVWRSPSAPARLEDECR